MIRPLGDSFAPTSAADEEGKKPNPAQSAIQVLSMRLPRVKGARSISPLIGEPGSAARRETPGGFSPDSAVLQTLMRAQAPTGTADAMSAPMGSMPGASSAGASDPMAAAMAALGGGMMNAGPSAPMGAPAVIPGASRPPMMPSYQPPPPMIGAGGGPQSEQSPTRPDREPPVYGELPDMPRERPREPREAWHGAPSAPAIPDQSYGGQSPVNPNGTPNEGYTGNTGINGGRPPAAPQPPVDIPVPELPNGGPPTGGGIDPNMIRALMEMLGGRGR